MWFVYVSICRLLSILIRFQMGESVVKLDYALSFPVFLIKIIIINLLRTIFNSGDTERAARENQQCDGFSQKYGWAIEHLALRLIHKIKSNWNGAEG